MPADLRAIADFAALLAWLGEELDWPIADYGLEDLTFEYDAAELGLKDEEAKKLEGGVIRQLRPRPGGQPFGIFFVEFGAATLPVVVLRRVLNALVVKKRASADRQRWHVADLLFISAFGAAADREIAFAHFSKHPATTELPVLRVLGWDGSDTTLKTDYVAGVLRERLRWPEDTADHDAWRAQWTGAFRHRPGHVIKTANALAETLADFARKIRDAATTVMAHESEAKGHLRTLHRAFKSALIHDLSEKAFADTYAQTVTYGLLTAAISRTEMSDGRNGTVLTQDDVPDMVPVTNPFLKEMLQEFLKVGGRKHGVDFDELGANEVVDLLRGEQTDLPAILRDFGNRQPGEDPVIHFYEHFLKAYDAELQFKRGVFYTPKPVVSYIVRSVHELLQTEFGLKDGLASTVTWGEMLTKHADLKLPPLTDLPNETKTISSDEPFVQILDPATGTATFLVEAIDVVHKHLVEKWKSEELNDQEQKDAWNAYVPKHLLPRLHGYELMMAPYAIAHMKIGLKLSETGYRFDTRERARVYLTNALEPWQEQLTLPDFEALAHEAEAVNEVKQYRPFTVVIGNPPYAGHSANKGKWIQSLVKDYYFVDEAPLGERNPKWLQDDYVKFIRFAQNALAAAGAGFLGFITNPSFLDNPTFRGMWQRLLSNFSEIRLLDLHGNARKRERTPGGGKDENVFDIQQGVVVTLSAITRSTDGVSEVRYAEIYGQRNYKYRMLARPLSNGTPGTQTAGQLTYKRVSINSPFYLLVPQDMSRRTEYEAGFSVIELFPTNGAGITTAHDDFVIGDKEGLLRRFQRFQKVERDGNILHQEFKVKRKRGWNIIDGYDNIKEDSNLEKYLHPISYRPFDNQHIFYEDRLVWRTVRKIMRHMMGEQNVGLVTVRQVAAGIFSHVFVTSSFIDNRITHSNKGIASLFPLYIRPDEKKTRSQDPVAFEPKREPNFSKPFLKTLSVCLGLGQRGKHGLPTGIYPEDVFHYIYSAFYSPSYRNRYAEFLKIDFPRVPLPGSLALFRGLSRLGEELVVLHLLESPALDTPRTSFIGNNRRVGKVGWTPDEGGTVWIDGKGSKAKFKPGTSGFHPVPEDVWNFHVGGYQVCEKWLKDRGPKKGNPGRILTDEDVAHYHKIVIALTETIRLMAEIDRVIDAHGGWPDAFATSKNARN